jgi:ubiquinone/menaquinone biosynthesis C-methylase UbiE
MKHPLSFDGAIQRMKSQSNNVMIFRELNTGSYIDRINKKTMRSSVDIYAQSYMLTPPERSALEYIKQNRHIIDQPILDIGVGGGRTVDTLREISKNYVGIDYVSGMVDACKRKFPGVHFEQGDARDLSRFPNESFSLVMFSLNGISMVNHQGRIHILNEIYRVLTPGGSFLFSTYNQDNPDYHKLLQFPNFQVSMNPLKLGVRSMRYVMALLRRALNRYRFKNLEFLSDEYSIINDKCHNYATMLYYITQTSQRQQLIAAAFDDEILAFDQSGILLEGDTLDDSIFYIARKLA